MPIDTHHFPTDGPIHLHARNGRGSVKVIAGDVTETEVEVSGRDISSARVTASEDGRRVSIDVARFLRIGNPPHIDFTVRVPTGSSVDIVTASATTTTSGVLGQAEVRTASGAVSIEQVDGSCKADSASGSVAIGTVGGVASLRSASGDLRVARASEQCTAKSASGAIDIGWAGDLVNAATASGSITVRDATAGEVTCKSTSGHVAVGVRKGSLVWLDLSTVSGRTTSGLQPESDPSGGDERVLRVKVHTVSGNITVAPSGADAAAA